MKGLKRFAPHKQFWVLVINIILFMNNQYGLIFSNIKPIPMVTEDEALIQAGNRF
jgi:hypothetical protein